MSKKEVSPIFIFSLPRSGSTLLQRILGNHPNIHTVSEPWLLLPLLNAVSNNNLYAEYSHYDASIAINEFACHLPRGKIDIYKEIRNSVINLYQKICSSQKPKAKYFLDKTPRYHLILDDIHRTFPDGKFIYLFRNPLSIVSSLLQTDPKGRWNLYFYNIDLFIGLQNLINSFEKHAPKSHFLKYEHLIENPDGELKNLSSYLGIDMLNTEKCLGDSSFLKGSMGDRLDHDKLAKLNKETFDKWKKSINNPIRKYWCKYYLKWIGPARLKKMGYDYKGLVSSLNNTDTKYHIQTIYDAYRIVFGVFYTNFELTIIKNNLLKKMSIFQNFAKT
jgi:hypothetical protein